jgi:hypothetical protein
MNLTASINKLYSRADLLANSSLVPKAGGLYFWFFKEAPPDVPLNGCVSFGGKTLLYAGISPKSPPQNGKPPSTQTLRDRVRYHLKGNAEGSTLRLSLGVLLSEQLGIQLRRVGSGKRMTFHDGEYLLNKWLDDNAFVGWLEHKEPWVIEAEAIQQISLPINLEGNNHHPFQETLKALRKNARDNARKLAIA